MTQALTSRQTDLLKRYESGVLRDELKKAVAAYGHGCLRSEDGDILNIGGSTGGVTRCLIDDWRKPDCQRFLDHSDTTRKVLESEA